MHVSVLCDIDCELGEGPTYDPETDTLWWFDIVNRKLAEKPLGADRVTFHGLPVMASALARIDRRRQLIVSEAGTFIRDTATGALSPHVAIEPDDSGTRSNDSRVHPCGAFWIGTMAKDHRKGGGAIYWLGRGELRRVFPNIGIPNAICFSPDGGIAHFTDSLDNRMMRVECDPKTGLPQGEPKVFFDNRSNKGVLDGSICDAEGNIWNARWGAGSLDCYSPAGERIRSIPIPATQSSCPAFVGKDAGAIAVTSAWQGMDVPGRAADPMAGFTFLVETKLKGRFEPDFRL